MRSLTRISSWCWSSLGSIFGLTFFLLYNNDLPDDVISNIAVCTADTTLFLIMLSVILLFMLIILLRHLICDNNYNWLLSLNLVNKTTWTVARTGWFISLLKKLNRFRLTCLITLKLLMWKWWICSWGTNIFKMLRLTFSSKLS